MVEKIAHNFITSMFEDLEEKKLVKFILIGMSPREIVGKIVTEMCEEKEND